MKRMNLQLLALSCVLLITNTVFATNQTFPAPPSELTLITEQVSPKSTPDPSLYPGGPVSSLPISITYTTGLWTNDVSSAKLRVCLQDDLSTNFPPHFDSPREFALITDIQDGTSSTPNTEVEISPNLFVAGEDGVPPPPKGTELVATATEAGIENPSILPSASSRCYEVDVTAMLNSSNTGTLSFNLNIIDHYPDITPTSNPDAFNLITAFAIANGVPPENPFHVWEDYVYEKAELVVIYGPTQPIQVPTLSEWSMILLMLFLAGFATRRLKDS